MGQQRRSFTPEFKQEAVDLCRRSGKSACQVAFNLLPSLLQRSGRCLLQEWCGWLSCARGFNFFCGRPEAL